MSPATSRTAQRQSGMDKENFQNGKSVQYPDTRRDCAISKERKHLQSTVPIWTQEALACKFRVYLCFLHPVQLWDCPKTSIAHGRTNSSNVTASSTHASAKVLSLQIARRQQLHFGISFIVSSSALACRQGLKSTANALNPSLIIVEILIARHQLVWLGGYLSVVIVRDLDTSRKFRVRNRKKAVYKANWKDHWVFEAVSVRSSLKTLYVTSARGLHVQSRDWKLSESWSTELY